MCFWFYVWVDICIINIWRKKGKRIYLRIDTIMDFSSKCDQIRRKLRIWPHLLKKSLMENFFFLQSQFINKFLKFEYFNHHAKVEMWLTLYKFPIFFPQLNLNSDITFPNWSIDLKLEVLNLGLRLY